MFFANKPKFDHNKAKVQLKCLVTRLDQRAAKKSNLTKVEKRKVAMLLKEDKEHNARILVEQIIRDDYVLESYEMIKQYADMLTARLNVLQLEPELKPEIADSVCALVYSGYCMGGEIEELKTLFGLFTAKYGKQFTEAVCQDKEKFLNDRFLKILTSTQTPDQTVVEAYLTEIARIYDVQYIPSTAGSQPMSTTLGIVLPTPGMPMPGTQVPAPMAPLDGGGDGGSGGGSAPPAVPPSAVPPPAAPPNMTDLTDLSGINGDGGAVPVVAVARAVTQNGTPMGAALPENAYSIALSKVASAHKEGGEQLQSGFGVVVDYQTNVVREVDLSGTPGVSVDALRGVAVGDTVVAVNGKRLDQDNTLKSIAADIDLGASAVFQLLRGAGAPPPPVAPAVSGYAGLPVAEQQPTVIGGPPPAPPAESNSMEDDLARRLEQLRNMGPPNV